eukprot:1231844-Prymnesium_polylepis.1
MFPVAVWGVPRAKRGGHFFGHGQCPGDLGGAKALNAPHTSISPTIPACAASTAATPAAAAPSHRRRR